MEEGSRKTALVIGAVAAAAGIAVMAYWFAWRLRAVNNGASPPLRSVSDLLNDCYEKVREIESHLPHLTASSAEPTPN